MNRPITVLLLIVALGAMPAASAQGPRVDEARFARLARGVNLNFWFWYPSEEPFTSDYIADDELAHLAAAGLTHVRLPFDPDRLMPDAGDPTAFDPVYLAGMDAAVARIIAAGLAVIIDPHPLSAAESDFREQIALSDAYVAATALPFYSALAEHFATTSADWLFFETMNEPVMHEFFPGTYDEQVAQGIARWNIVQPQIVAALRAGAPDHTLIVKGDTWDNIPSLLALDMAGLTDDNLVFNIHYYNPFVFTHQGATWTWEAVRPLRAVPYPSSPAAVAPLLDKYTGETRDALAWYGQERWDASRVRAELAAAAEWAATHGVRLTVNEFGVYKPNAPAKDRLALLKDMRAAFDEFGMGWAMWDYDGGFDLVSGLHGSRVIDAPMASALGLDLPEAISLETPAQDSVMTTRAARFRWSAPPGALKYRVELRGLRGSKPYQFAQVFAVPAAICDATACETRLKWAGRPPKDKARVEWRAIATLPGGAKTRAPWQYFTVRYG